MVEIKECLANKNNYGSKRNTSSIKYIVIHYTGNDGDKDENNGMYFKNNIVKASAHYFVDSDSITRSVPDNYIAYSVGGSRYSDHEVTGGAKYYGKCTNANSISIELCDDIKDGVVYPSGYTIQNAVELTKTLMQKYNIPATNVIRHFDVNGKKCPLYWCGDSKKNNLWKTAFHNKLVVTSKKETTTTTTKTTFKEYKVKINTDVLKIRKGAGTSYGTNGSVKKGEVYTIVDEKWNGTTLWGKLKSGRGYISLKYTKKV